ncbi:MAG: hypothetical protein NVS2B12_27900 [Ktedonobacteraceae bacterium]
MELPHNPDAGSQAVVQPMAGDKAVPETLLKDALSTPALPSHGVLAEGEEEDVQPSILTMSQYEEAVAPLKPRSASYWAVLVLAGSLVPLPIAAATITATLHIIRTDWSTIVPMVSPKLLVIFIGALGTLLLWLLASLPFKRFTTFDAANVHSASHLRRHILALKSGLKIIYEHIHSKDAKEKTLHAFRAANPYDYDLALDDVCSCLCEANWQVERGHLSWIMGSGYIEVWNFVQRAEEAMLGIAPREYVIREALHDEASIAGSTIANRDYILSNIKTAVKLLSPSASIYLKSLSVQDREVVATNITATNLVLAPTITSPLQNQEKQLDPTTELEARNALRDARQTLNEFRSGLWDGLVTQRNQLLGTALITALLTYILLFVAIGADINAEAMKAALVFYLVGSIVGLFSRLYTESNNNRAIDDYGLTVARVLVTPLLSGLAAIAGVLVIAVLSINILNAPGATSGAGLPQLGAVYDIVQNRQGIIVAALFGLAPNRLINILQQKADSTEASLKNSSAPSQGHS